jgi:hypothetical protein
MALNGDALGTTIKNTLLALNPDSGLLSGAENALLEDYWQAVANDIIDHYEANADILPGTFQTLDVTTGVELVTGIGTIT